MDYSCIFYVIIATIIVTVKLVLEQQRDSDRKNGIEQIASSYTIKGMIHLIRNERKRKKNIPFNTFLKLMSKNKNLVLHK